MPDYIEGWPYVVMWGEHEAARFPDGEVGKANAETLAKETAGNVVDTTRIPADAQFIHWVNGDGSPYYARRTPEGKWETDEEVLTTELNLLEYHVGDSEVTVLDPR